MEDLYLAQPTDVDMLDDVLTVGAIAVLAFSILSVFELV